MRLSHDQTSSRLNFLTQDKSNSFSFLEFKCKLSKFAQFKRLILSRSVPSKILEFALASKNSSKGQCDRFKFVISFAKQFNDLRLLHPLKSISFAFIPSISRISSLSKPTTSIFPSLFPETSKVLIFGKIFLSNSSILFPAIFKYSIFWVVG